MGFDGTTWEQMGKGGILRFSAVTKRNVPALFLP
jgi:hypothetical protein